MGIFLGKGKGGEGEGESEGRYKGWEGMGEREIGVVDFFGNLGESYLDSYAVVRHQV